MHSWLACQPVILVPNKCFVCVKKQVGVLQFFTNRKLLRWTSKPWWADSKIYCWRALFWLCARCARCQMQDARVPECQSALVPDETDMFTLRTRSAPVSRSDSDVYQTWLLLCPPRKPMTIFTIPAALRFYGHQLCFMGVLKTLSSQKLSATSLLVTLSPLKSSQPIPTGDPSIYGKGHFQATVEKQRLKSTGRKAGSASKGGLKETKFAQRSNISDIQSSLCF